MSKLWCLILMNKHICRLQLQLRFKPCFVIRFAHCVVFACCFRMWPTYALYLLPKPDQTLHGKCLFLLLSRVRWNMHGICNYLIISIYYIKIKYMRGDTYNIYLIIKISLWWPFLMDMFLCLNGLNNLMLRCFACFAGRDTKSK